MIDTESIARGFFLCINFFNLNAFLERSQPTESTLQFFENYFITFEKVILGTLASI